MAKNISKIIILAWLALQPFIFSCGSEAEKERRRVEKEMESFENELSNRYFANFSKKIITSKDSSFFFISLKESQEAAKEAGLEGEAYYARVRHDMEISGTGTLNWYIKKLMRAYDSIEKTNPHMDERAIQFELLRLGNSE